MIIGIPKEIKEDEYRVAIVPSGVRTLKEHGHLVIIEKGAGEGCRIEDIEYEAAGAEVVIDPVEIYSRADMVMKVKEPLPSENHLFREGQILFAYLHLSPAPELTDALLKAKIIAVAYETIQTNDGFLPLLAPMSEVAGKMSVQVGAHFLEKTQGGRGVLLGGVPGVRRGRVTILGAGTVGLAAAKIAVGLGSDVYILDIDQRRLAHMEEIFGNRVTTLISNYENVVYSVVNSHLVIGAVLNPGACAPRIVTRELIRQMKAGAVIVDVAIDQGGCVETARPTTHRHPTFVVDDVIHYCVPNMPGAVARTSTFALTNVTLPFALAIADKGIHQAALQDVRLARGVNLYKGLVTHKAVANALGFAYNPVDEIVRN
jgi:alanine dehydrogenase